MGLDRIKKKRGRPKNEPIIRIQGVDALMTDTQRRHWKVQFKVKKKVKNGKIILELTPRNKLLEKRNKLIEKISKYLAKSVDSEALMTDVLDDSNLEKLEKLDKALKRGATVKPREGCFFLEIKDPRRKKAMRVQLRS